MACQPPKRNDHFFIQFLDPAEPVWRQFRASVENNSIPLGSDCYYALSLGRNGPVELGIKDYHGYTFELELHLIVRGKWELRTLEEHRFAIQIHEPEVEILLEGPNLPTYLKAIEEGHRWVCREADAGFSSRADSPC